MRSSDITLPGTETAQPPATPAVSFDRAHLLTSAIEASPQAKLLAVIAPPGYGKTTLLTQWARLAKSQGEATVWLRLQGEACVEGLPGKLWRALSTAGYTTSCSWAGGSPSTCHVPDILEEAAAQNPFTLILDGLDNPDDSVRETILLTLLDALPDGCRIAVTSRHGLAPRFELMLACEEAIAINAELLRFTAEETRSWFDSIPDHRDIASELTLGWPLALKLFREMVMSGRLRPVLPQLLANELCQHPALQACFRAVLQHQTTSVQALLHQLSHLDVVPSSLINSLGDPDIDGSTVQLLRSRNLFLLPAQTGSQLFQLHPLFAAWLRLGASPQSIAQTRAKAIDWLLRHGYYVLVQSYLCTVDNTDFVAQLLVSSGGWTLLFRGGPTVARILQSLPIAVLQANPVLELARIYRLVQSGEIAVARKAFEGLKVRTRDFAAADTPHAPTPADGMVMELLLSLYEDRSVSPKALIKAEMSIGVDQADQQSIRPSVIRELLSWSYYQHGNFQKALAIGQESVDLCVRANIPYVQIYAYLAIGLAELAEGKVTRAAGAYALAESEAVRHFGNECNQVMAAQILGAEILLARNQIDDARNITAYWNEAIVQGDGWVDLHASLWRTLSSALRALGDMAAARHILQQARHLAQERHLWRLDQILENHQLRETCLSGDLQQAAHIAQAIQFQHPRSVSVHHQGWRVWVPRMLALARYALESGDFVAGIEALREIDTQSLVAPGNHKLLALERDLLESRLLFAMRDSHWHHSLSRALSFATDYHLLRPVLDEGSALHDILDEYRETCRPSENIRAFLDELSLARQATTGDREEFTAMREDAAPLKLALDQGEPLSKREFDVLALIGEGLTSKEIARRLSISVNTVLTYRKSLHRKLCATTRSQLITIAREQHILEAAPASHFPG